MSQKISISPVDQAVVNDLRCRLDRDPRVDSSRVAVDCVDRAVTLSGSVAWGYQKLAAEFDARAIAAVRAVDNRIDVRSAVSPEDVMDSIAGFSSTLGWPDASHVRVDVSGRVVTLMGTVASSVGKGAAERAAWRTPGVCEVRNRIEITREGNPDDKASNGGRPDHGSGNCGDSL